MNPIALEKLPMSIELRISLSPFIKCTRLLRPCHVNLGVFTRTPFSLYPVWRNLTLQRMDGATVDAWLYFPGTKVGQNRSLFFLFGNFWRRWLKIVVTDYVYSWARQLTATVFSPFLFFSQWGFTKNLICRTTADQACFVLNLTTFSVGKPSHLKIFEL
jgi:hypothetical protein